MADAATYSHSIGSDNRWIVIVVQIIVESFGIPLFLGVIVEIRIGEQPETQDGGRFSRRLRIVAWLVFLTAVKRQHYAANDAGSDSCETEKIATGGWQQHLHRATIDTPLANGVARKIQSISLNLVTSCTCLHSL